jgi:hypothetical protein
VKEFYFRTVSAVPGEDDLYEVRQFKLSEGELVDQGVVGKAPTAELAVNTIPTSFVHLPKDIVADAFYLTFVSTGVPA